MAPPGMRIGELTLAKGAGISSSPAGLNDRWAQPPRGPGRSLHPLSLLLMARPNWSCPLPRPLSIAGVMKLKTLGDVRKLLSHLPADTCRWVNDDDRSSQQ
jgi:hypothetical protein